MQTAHPEVFQHRIRSKYTTVDRIVLIKRSNATSSVSELKCLLLQPPNWQGSPSPSSASNMTTRQTYHDGILLHNPSRNLCVQHCKHVQPGPWFTDLAWQNAHARTGCATSHQHILLHQDKKRTDRQTVLSGSCRAPSTRQCHESCLLRSLLSLSLSLLFRYNGI